MKKTPVNKIAIYDPYILALGGGERYVLTLAEFFLSKGKEVSLVIPPGTGIRNPDIAQKLRSRFNLDLKGLKIVKVPDKVHEKLASKLGFYPISLRKFDLVFYLTNELPKISLNKNSVLIIQFPFDGDTKIRLDPRSIKRYLRQKLLFLYRLKIVYSNYSRDWVDRLWRIKSIVLYPSVETALFKPNSKKVNQIISVGRFSKFGHNKKQLELINAFKKISSNNPTYKWRYVLAGGVMERDTDYINELVRQSAGFPINIKVNAPIKQLIKDYGRSKIFWHGAGLGEDQNKNPERFEHFGITTVEAMSAGCVPVVINRGGQPDIVRNNQDGFLWNNEKELIEMTEKLMRDQRLIGEFSHKAKLRSKSFSKKVFLNSIQKLLVEYDY